MKEIKMLKLPLQFFGEDGGGDEDNDFTDNFFDDGSDYYDTDEFDDDGDPDDDADADLDVDDGVDGDADNIAQGANDDAQDANDDAQDANDDAQGANNDAQGANDDLISELRALGYVGNDLAALTADMKAKREAQEAQDAKREAAATKAAGKNHIRSGKPGKSASGDGTGGVTERQVEHFVSLTKESRESARQRLTRHARLIEGK